MQYLKGERSGPERHAFERELEKDPFEREALEGLEMLTPEQAEEGFLSLHTRLRKRLSRRRRIAWYSAAASIASLLIIGTIFLQVYDFNPESNEKTVQEDLFPAGPSGEPATPADDRITLEEAPGIADQAEAVKPVTGAPESSKKEEPSPSRMAPEVPKKAAMEVEEDAQRERIIHVEAVATPPEEQAHFDQVVPEAEAAPLPEEGARALSGRRAEMQQKAISQDKTEMRVLGEMTGTVVSGEDMKPLPGASVVVKGNNTGVVTDMAGQFTLPVEDDSNRTVVANFVGMEPGEYQLSREGDNQLVMQPDARTLDEVVVAGQGLQPAGAPSHTYSTVRLGTTQPGRSGSAEPAGGFDGFKEYVGKQMRFPELETSGDREVVILGFTVTVSGEIRDITPLRSNGEPFTQEATRLLLEGPPWKPAFDENGPLEEYVRLRIVFKRLSAPLETP